MNGKDLCWESEDQPALHLQTITTLVGGHPKVANMALRNVLVRAAAQNNGRTALLAVQTRFG